MRVPDLCSLSHMEEQPDPEREIPFAAAAAAAFVNQLCKGELNVLLVGGR